MASKDIQPIGVDVPHDVQRLIFEVAARLSISTAKALLTLCKYVYPWSVSILLCMISIRLRLLTWLGIRIEAVLYESVVLRNQDEGIVFSRLCMDKPDSFFTARTKSLCCMASVRSSDIVRALRSCKEIKFLGVWNPDAAEDPSFTYMVSRLHLTRVSIGHALFMALVFDSQPIMFPHATHFELILTFHPEDDALTIINSMPSLTHLCISWMFPSTGVDIVHYMTALSQNSQLKVILFLFDNLGFWLFQSWEGSPEYEWADGSRDKRIVLGSDNPISEHHPLSSFVIPGPGRYFFKDWLYRLPGDFSGTWEAAEDVVARRTQELAI